MTNCFYTSNLAISALYLKILVCFSERQSDFFDIVEIGVEIAVIGFWFFIAPITVEVMVVIVSLLIIRPSIWLGAW